MYGYNLLRVRECDCSALGWAGELQFRELRKKCVEYQSALIRHRRELVAWPAVGVVVEASHQEANFERRWIPIMLVMVCANLDLESMVEDLPNYRIDELRCGFVEVFSRLCPYRFLFPEALQAATDFRFLTK